MRGGHHWLASSDALKQTNTCALSPSPSRQALRFHAAMEALPGGCILDLEVVSEERCTREEAMLYPANACRNRALALAQTEVWGGRRGVEDALFGCL